VDHRACRPDVIHGVPEQSSAAADAVDWQSQTIIPGWSFDLTRHEEAIA